MDRLAVIELKGVNNNNQETPFKSLESDFARLEQFQSIPCKQNCLTIRQSFIIIIIALTGYAIKRIVPQLDLSISTVRKIGLGLIHKPSYHFFKIYRFIFCSSKANGGATC